MLVKQDSVVTGQKIEHTSFGPALHRQKKRSTVHNMALFYKDSATGATAIDKVKSIFKHVLIYHVFHL